MLKHSYGIFQYCYVELIKKKTKKLSKSSKYSLSNLWFNVFVKMSNQRALTSSHKVMDTSCREHMVYNNMVINLLINLYFKHDFMQANNFSG